MKTTIKFPNTLVERQYNSAIVSALASVIVVGVMLIMSHNMIDFEDDSLYSMLISAAIAVVVIAASILSFSLKQTVALSSGSPLICKTIEFKESEYAQFREAIKQERWSELTAIAQSDTGVAMKIEMVYSKDRSFAAYQFFKYVPHSYEPCDDIIYLNREVAANIGNS